jgi:nucleoside-diphosphate-sugar epimerase
MSHLKMMVTGASGFVGRALVSALVEDGIYVNCPVRPSAQVLLDGVDFHEINGIDAFTDWDESLRSCSVVVHLAARVHVMKESSQNPLEAFRTVNVEGTKNLARQAALCGVKRFIYLSSVKSCAETSVIGSPLTCDSEMHPMDAYGVSKMEAEIALSEISKETGMEIVIIRSPLVYGPGVKANFASLIRFIRLGIPLPLGGLSNNRRSFIGVDNLVSFIKVCINHPAAAGQTFVVSDGDDMSTKVLVQRLSKAMGRSVRLFNVTPMYLKFILTLMGKRSFFDRLNGTLQVDISRNLALLGWSPPVSVDDGFVSMLKDDGAR